MAFFFTSAFMIKKIKVILHVLDPKAPDYFYKRKEAVFLVGFSFYPVYLLLIYFLPY